MTELSSRSEFALMDRQLMMRRWMLAALLGIVAVALSHTVDAWAWAHVRNPQIYDGDGGRMLRIVGFLPTWLVVALALWLHDRPQPGWRWRGALMVLGPTVGGAVAELSKLLIRRLRPGDLSPEYLFRPFSVDTWSTRGLGIPSSHACAGPGALRE